MEEIPMFQLAEEEDGLESDTNNDNTFFQASPDLTYYTDDLTYQGIPNFDQDKCRVIVQCKIKAMVERTSLGLINQKNKIEAFTIVDPEHSKKEAFKSKKRKKNLTIIAIMPRRKAGHQTELTKVKAMLEKIFLKVPVARLSNLLMKIKSMRHPSTSTRVSYITWH
jgi:hypothetical protein